MEFYLDTENKVIVINKRINSEELKKFLRKLPEGKKFDYVTEKEYDELKRKNNAGT